MAAKCEWSCPNRSRAVDATLAAWRDTCRHNAHTHRQHEVAADCRMRRPPLRRAMVDRLLHAIRRRPAQPTHRALVHLIATTRGTTRTLDLAHHRATMTEERRHLLQHADTSREGTTEEGRPAETERGTEDTTEADMTHTIRRPSHADHTVAGTIERHLPARHLQLPIHHRQQRTRMHRRPPIHHRPAARAVGIIETTARESGVRDEVLTMQSVMV